MTAAITCSIILFISYIFSASHDQSAMLWVWNVSGNSVDCVVTCRGHDKGVECLAVSADANQFATGSWDNNICLWSTSEFLMWLYSNNGYSSH